MQPLFFLTMVTIKDGVSLRRLHCPFTYNPTYVPSLITTALGALLTSPAAVHAFTCNTVYSKSCICKYRNQDVTQFVVRNTGHIITTIFLCIKFKSFHNCIYTIVTIGCELRRNLTIFLFILCYKRSGQFICCIS